MTQFRARLELRGQVVEGESGSTQSSQCVPGRTFPEPSKQMAAITPIFKGWKPRPRVRKDLPNITQLVRTRAGLETQVFRFFSLPVPASS